MEEDVRVIPRSMEKYSAIMTKRFKFIDSKNHLKASLDNLAELVEDTADKYLSNYVDKYSPSLSDGKFWNRKNQKRSPK